MEIDPMVLIIADIGIAIGHYSIFHLFLTKDFTQRFKKFKDGSDIWWRKQVKALLSELQQKADISDPQDLMDFLDKWTERQMTVRYITQEYYQLGNPSKYGLILFLLASCAAFLEIWYPSKNALSQLSWMGVSLFLMFLGMVAVFYYLLKYHALSGKIAKYETGIPIDRIVEEELQKKKD